MCPVTAFVPLATLPLAVLTMLVNVSRPAFFLQNRVPPKPYGNLIVEFVDDRGVGAWITADVELPGWGGCMSQHNGATGTAGSHARAMPPPKPLRDPRTQPARGPCSRLLPRSSSDCSSAASRCSQRGLCLLIFVIHIRV